MSAERFDAGDEVSSPHPFAPSGPGGTCGHAFDPDFKSYCGLPPEHLCHRTDGCAERFDHPCHAGDFGQPCGDAGSSATPNVVVPADLFAEVIDSLEQCDCQFWACKGETLTPIDMVTCHRCATLARLRTLATAPYPTSKCGHPVEWDDDDFGCRGCRPATCAGCGAEIPAGGSMCPAGADGSAAGVYCPSCNAEHAPSDTGSPAGGETP